MLRYLTLALVLLASTAQAATIALHTERTTPFHQRVEFILNDQTYTARSDAPFSFSADGYVDTDALTFTLTGFSYTLPTGSLEVQSDPFDLSYTRTETIDPPGFEPPYTVTTTVNLEDVRYILKADWEPSSEFWPQATTINGQVLPDPYVAALHPQSLDGSLWFGSVGAIHLTGGLGEEARFVGHVVMRAMLSVSCEDNPAPVCNMGLSTWLYGGSATTNVNTNTFDFLPDGTLVMGGYFPFDPTPQAPEPRALWLGLLPGILLLSLRRARWSDRRSQVVRR